MNRFPTPRATALVAVLALGALAVMAGCAKKVTTVDAGYTTLEGHHDPNARLVAWVDTPDSVAIWTDLGTPGPSPDPDLETDTLLALEPSYNTGPGVIHTMILDGTQANGYVFYRRSANGGLEAITDYTIPPAVKWLSSGWEAYSLADPSPGPYAPPTYVARGLVGGIVSAQSPVTSSVSVNATRPVQSIRYLASTTPTDSLFTMSWSAVPGAAGYWIHIYQWKPSATNDEKRRSGTPSPVWDGNVKHIFVGYIPGGSTTSYKLGAPGAEVLTFVTPIRTQGYYVRITAMDAGGNVIAWMKGDVLLQLGEGSYRYFPLAAVVVTPHR